MNQRGDDERAQVSGDKIEEQAKLADAVEIEIDAAEAHRPLSEKETDYTDDQGQKRTRSSVVRDCFARCEPGEESDRQ